MDDGQRGKEGSLQEKKKQLSELSWKLYIKIQVCINCGFFNRFTFHHVTSIHFSVKPQRPETTYKDGLYSVQWCNLIWTSYCSN